jgi:hypothetical protein
LFLHFKVPHASEEDLARWKDAFAQMDAGMRASLAAGKLQSGRLLWLFFDHEVDSACIAVAEGDTEAFRERLRKALRYFDDFLRFEPRSKVVLDHVYLGSENALFASLMLRDPDAGRLAREVLPYVTGDDGTYRREFVAAIEALLANDRARARRIAEDAIAHPANRFWRSLFPAVAAIADGEGRSFVTHVGAEMVEYDAHVKREGSGTLDAVVFKRGATLVKVFERLHGVDTSSLGLDDRLLPDL